MRKDLVISSLCSEIKNLENDIKVLEKPKGMLKKLTSLLSEVNESQVKTEIMALNRKYEKKAEQCNEKKTSAG